MAQLSSERRRDKRTSLTCSVKLLDRTGELLAESKTINISDGGMLLSLPVKSLPSIGNNLNCEVALPRFTSTSFMFERFTSNVRVLRHQPMVDDRYAGMALGFAQPQKLMLAAQA